jgi:histidyl-tRNA synthetase
MILTQPLKGFRDFLPQDAAQRKTVIATIQRIFERFGFDPLETPALEYEETLMGKYGTEADKLLYRFEDNGKRKVGLRYDQTVPLSRVIAQYPDLPMPFKRYQIQPVWRAENTQKGRYREFLQCDIDTVGTNSIIADAEIIACVLTVAKELRLPSPMMMINDRRLFDELGLSVQEIIIIDKLNKIGKDNVEEELRAIGGESTVEKFKNVMNAQPTERLQQIFTMLEAGGFKNTVDFEFDPTLARGLDYYTSTVYELKDRAYPAGSLAGGGRYDKLIGSFSGKDTPAVGVAFGFDRLIDALTELQLLPIKKTTTQVLVTCFDEQLVSTSMTATSTLRSKGINAELYTGESLKLEKQLKFADKKGIHYAIIIGPEENEKGVVNLKNLQTREEQKGILLEEAVNIVCQ